MTGVAVSPATSGALGGGYGSTDSPHLLTPQGTSPHDCHGGWVDLGNAVARCPQCVQERKASEVAHARTSDPETSHQAAASLGNITETQKFVLARLSECGPITDEGLINYINQRWSHKHLSEESIRTRRHELTKHGLVKDTGTRRMTSRNRKSRVWKVV